MSVQTKDSSPHAATLQSPLGYAQPVPPEAESPAYRALCRLAAAYGLVLAVGELFLWAGSVGVRSAPTGDIFTTVVRNASGFLIASHILALCALAAGAIQALRNRPRGRLTAWWAATILVGLGVLNGVYQSSALLARAFGIQVLILPYSTSSFSGPQLVAMAVAAEVPAIAIPLSMLVLTPRRAARRDLRQSRRRLNATLIALVLVWGTAGAVAAAPYVVLRYEYVVRTLGSPPLNTEPSLAPTLSRLDEQGQAASTAFNALLLILACATAVSALVAGERGRAWLRVTCRLMVAVALYDFGRQTAVAVLTYQNLYAGRFENTFQLFDTFKWIAGFASRAGTECALPAVVLLLVRPERPVPTLAPSPPLNAPPPP